MDGEVTWIHFDHLHSATILTDEDGVEIRRLAYRAFGEALENTGTGAEAKYSYTGKELDSSGLMYYDPALARFITADTVYDAGPQGLNRYSYALNNPILYNDPSGNSTGVDPETGTLDPPAEAPPETEEPLDITLEQLPVGEEMESFGDGLYYNLKEAIPAEPATAADVLKEYDYEAKGLSRTVSNISGIYGPIERSDAETVRMQIELLRGNYRQAFQHWKNSWKAAAVEPGTYVEFAMAMGTSSHTVTPSPRLDWSRTRR